MENLVDGYGRPVIDRKERQALQAIESKGAMADYKRAEQHKRENLAKLRTERLERELAVHKPGGDAHKGAVKTRTQLAKKRADFTKQDKTNGEFMALKKDQNVKGRAKRKEGGLVRRER